MVLNDADVWFKTHQIRCSSQSKELRNFFLQDAVDARGHLNL